MADPKIDPKKVTKPIQLLAAWLVGLLLINSAFLGTAVAVTEPFWAPGALIIASIVNVPLFLACIFVLQTRYRPEMQEDSFYSKYLDKQSQTMQFVPSQDVIALRAEISESNSRTLDIIQSIQDQLASIENSAIKKLKSDERDIVGDKEGEPRQQAARVIEAIDKAKWRVQWDRYGVSVNDLLPAFSEIRNTLNEVSIPINQVFGTTSIHPEVPEFGILGFGDNVDIEAIATLVRLLKGHGIDYIGYSDTEVNEGNIYIGSYGYRGDSQPFALIDDDVMAALENSDMTTERLAELIKGKSRLRLTN